MIVVLAAAAIVYFALLGQPKVRRAALRLRTGIATKVMAVGFAAAAIAILLHGNLWIASCLFGAALWLLGQARKAPRPSASSPARSSGRREWRSATVVLSQNGVGGRFSGSVVAGPLRGAALDALAIAQVVDLRGACLGVDPQGARLLEAYLDGRFPAWREAHQADGHAGERRARSASLMSEDEAYETLGLRRGETPDDVKRAHRAIMKKWHPDQGGSSDLAARANAAKEVLLRRHGRYS